MNEWIVLFHDVIEPWKDYKYVTTRVQDQDDRIMWIASHAVWTLCQSSADQRETIKGNGQNWQVGVALFSANDPETCRTFVSGRPEESNTTLSLHLAEKIQERMRKSSKKKKSMSGILSWRTLRIYCPLECPMTMGVTFYWGCWVWTIKLNATKTYVRFTILGAQTVWFSRRLTFAINSRLLEIAVSTKNLIHRYVWKGCWWTVQWNRFRSRFV